MQRTFGACLVILMLACATTYDGARPVAAPMYAAGLDRATSEGGQIPAPPMPLSDAETRQAASAALTELRRRDPALAAGRIFFVHAEMLNDKAAGRRALVQHYRYEGDVTFTSIVDLAANQVVDVRSAAHVPTPLSPEEVSAAQTRALQEAPVRSLTSQYGQVTLEPRAIRSTSPDDPLFGHRAIEFFFLTPRGYLVNTPRVIVDLTADRVLIQERPPSAPPHM